MTGPAPPGPGLRRFVAGCGRYHDAPVDEPELAYRALAFPECPGCVHRIHADPAPPFCLWRADRPDPFAALAGWPEGTG